MSNFIELTTMFSKKPITINISNVTDIRPYSIDTDVGTIVDCIGGRQIDVVEKYGADALRFSVIIITAQGQDVFLSDQKFEIGRNFANKIWNASRFLLMFMEDFSEPDKTVFTPDDKYILYCHPVREDME